MGSSSSSQHDTNLHLQKDKNKWKHSIVQPICHHITILMFSDTAVKQAAGGGQVSLLFMFVDMSSENSEDKL